MSSVKILKLKDSGVSRTPLLSRGGKSRGVASAGVVLVKKPITGQHHPGASRHPSSAEEYLQPRAGTITRRNFRETEVVRARW